MALPPNRHLWRGGPPDIPPGLYEASPPDTARYRERVLTAMARDQSGWKTPRRRGRKVAADGLPTEAQEQAALCRWLDAAGIVYFAVPNGAYLAGRGVERAIRWKALARSGCKPGVPDLVIATPPPNGGPSPVAVELKRARGGRVTIEQYRWQWQLRGCGWLAIVARGADDGITQLSGLGYGP